MICIKGMFATNASMARVFPKRIEWGPLRAHWQCIINFEAANDLIELFMCNAHQFICVCFLSTVAWGLDPTTFKCSIFQLAFSL